MKNKIEEIYSPKAIEQLTLINKLLIINVEKLEKSALASSELSKILGNGATSAKDMAQAQRELNKIQQDNEVHLKKIESLELKLQKQKEQTAKATQKQTQEEKDLQKLRSATVGSINQLNAVNNILEKRLKSVNLETEKGAKQADRLRSAIDKNNAKIKENSSALTAQKMNIGNYGSALDGLKNGYSKIIGLLGSFGVALGIASVAQKVFNGFIEAGQVMGDKYAEVKQGMTQATTAFFLSIQEGDWSNLIDNMVKAYDAGVQYAQMLDLLEDKNRALTIATARADEEIVRMKNIARDNSKTLKERSDAIDRIVYLEEQKLKKKKEISQQELDNELQMASTQSKLSKEAITRIIGDIQLQEKLGKAREVLNDIMSVSYETIQLRTGGTQRIFNENTYNKLLKEQTSEMQSLIYFETQYGRLNKETRDKIGESIKKNIDVEKEYNDGIGSTVKIQNKLRNEFLRTGNTQKQIQDDWLKRLQEINSFEQNTLNKRINDEKTNTDERIYLIDLLLEKQDEIALKQYENDLKNAKNVKEREHIETMYYNNGVLRFQEAEQKKSEIRIKSQTELQNSLDEANRKELEVLTNNTTKQISEIERRKNIKKTMLLQMGYSEEQLSQELVKLEFEATESIIKVNEDLVLKQIEILKSRTDLTEEETNKLVDLELKLSEFRLQTIENENKQKEEADKKDAELNQKKIERLEAYNQLVNDGLEIAQTVSDAIYGREIELIDRKMAKYDQESIQYKALAREKAELEYKQAILNKALAVAASIINTAVGVTAALAVQNYVGAVLTGIKGLAETTAIIAQPLPEIPSFRKGTDDFKGGPARFGEAGREIVELPTGQMILANREIIANLPEHTKIHNNLKTEQILRNMNGQVVLKATKLEALMEQNNKLMVQLIKKPTKNNIFVIQKQSYLEKYKR